MSFGARDGSASVFPAAERDHAGHGAAPRDFALPAELRGLSVARLRDEVEREELRRKCATARCFDLDDDWDDEPDWEAPWAMPLGAVVWCKMQGFVWWPALVANPAVADRDIARLRDEGFLFIDFLGWNAKRSAQAKFAQRGTPPPPPPPWWKVAMARDMSKAKAPLDEAIENYMENGSEAEEEEEEEEESQPWRQ